MHRYAGTPLHITLLIKTTLFAVLPSRLRCESAMMIIILITKRNVEKCMHPRGDDAGEESFTLLVERIKYIVY